VLHLDEARAVAGRAGVYLEGLTGDHLGMIGALAGVGLRRSGTDGRFVWLEGVRELSGVLSVADLLAKTGIHAIEDRQRTPIPAGDRICVEPWPRAVLIHGRAVLLVERPEKNNVAFDWQLLPREDIRRY